ncbi:MAG: hypothetical protein ACK5OQ_16275 [Burkholderiales bacterium]|jgi:hypothetical protein
MKTIKLNSVYMHQGQKMSPKLVYSVDDAVADGLVGLGLAELTLTAQADLTLDGLTWESGTALYAAPVLPKVLAHLED